MCGRFAFYSPREAVADTFGLDLGPDAGTHWQPRFNIAPTQPVVVLRSGESGQPALALLRWGLVPSWAKDPSVGNRMINARAETVTEKPSFRAAFRRRRCVVLADGFYEWQKTGGGSQPHYIRGADGRPFAMAGLWEHWDKGDRPLETCSIITIAANTAMAAVHHRMPVILEPGDLSIWLAGSDGQQQQALLQPCADDRLESYPVSRQVNSPRNDGPELIEPAAG